MQRLINELRGQNKTKQEIENNPEFIRHQGNYNDASNTLAELNQAITDKEKDLVERQQQIAQYKVELQNMQKSGQKLREEKSEAQADMAIAEQQQQIAGVLNGIQASTVDKDLASVREARKEAKQKAKITSELAGNDARHAESEYLNLAAESTVSKELDSLLDWGDNEAGAKMEDAKLPE